jgi:hypothetical protein
LTTRSKPPAANLACATGASINSGSRPGSRRAATTRARSSASPSGSTPTPVAPGCASNTRSSTSPAPHPVSTTRASGGSASAAIAPVGLLARAADLAGDRPGAQLVKQRDQLGDVVTISAGQRHRERDARRVDDQVVL